MSRALAKFVPALALAVALAAPAAADDNDYPTEARADYVFGCMAANGQTREALTKCACSIDAIAAVLPYDKYVQASTILSMRQGIGQRSNEFRSTKLFDDKVAELRRAQAEAEILCYRHSASGG
ncbi:hypothetical protein [Methylobacterium oryzihabitans]|uniref:Lysozyme inhibitor LprI N-terminal domain-containing protein n=1 Tax=Methylobacterium oryzihabitans TaxID=2499852 RepID=A0A3S2VPQ0_9HYPH|nr:hypothetical protein [Methylobacterium oryzihabitans]RVU17812.1 hypothetical protein EOE48_13110 [Methylobacterium oryzihabitans]